MKRLASLALALVLGTAAALSVTLQAQADPGAPYSRDRYSRDDNRRDRDYHRERGFYDKRPGRFYPGNRYYPPKYRSPNYNWRNYRENYPHYPQKPYYPPYR